MLEEAIATGKHSDASNLAKKLAKFQLTKANSVVQSSSTKSKQERPTTLNLSSPSLPSSIEEKTNKMSASSSASPSNTKDFLSVVTGEEEFISFNSSENFSFTSESFEEAREEEFKRSNKVDPIRREVKSDIGTPHMETIYVEDIPFSVEMFVEDKSSHQGPIQIEVLPSMNVGQLKTKVS